MSNNNVYGGPFCSPDELQISTIGTGYLANYVSGGGGRQAGGTLTNRRVYFSGSVYTRDGRGRFVSYEQRKIVNTRDVTGTGYDFYRPTHFLLWGFILFLIPQIIIIVTDYLHLLSMSLLIGAVLALPCIILYFIKRMTLLSIEYAGGNIAFDVRWIQKHEQDDFIRNLHLAKDKLYSTAAEAQGFLNRDDPADEIPEL